MITTLKYLSILAFVTLVTYGLPTVTELPFGIDDAMVLFISTIRSLVAIIPFMVVPYYLIIAMLSIRFSLFVWHWIRWIIGLIR